MPRCKRAPDCGDGHACNDDGLCIVGERQSGDRCTSEVECEPGLACVLDVASGPDQGLGASCAPDHDGHAFGALCERDDECRNGTCSLGRCIDVCATDRDCATEHVCTTIPRVDDAAVNPTFIGTYHGCVPAGGTIEWPIPVSGTADDVYLPIPGNARSAVVVMSIDDALQTVGATRLIDPHAVTIYQKPTDIAQYFTENKVRHLPTFGTSVMMIPSQPDVPLEPGPYLLGVSSFRPPADSPGTASPRVKIIVKLGDGTVLDLHFYFLDLAAHPCTAALQGTLDAAAAGKPDSPFQKEFLAQLRLIFARAGIALGTTTFADLPGHADLDGLDSAALPELLSLSKDPGGVSVFIVRTIAPVGLQALVGGSPNPGDPSAGSRAGGVAIAIDSMCYRSWAELARVTAHAIGRDMGLYRNVEPPLMQGTFEDPIADSPGASDPVNALSNLMYYSEFGGSTLSEGQKDILRRSAVLR